MEANTKYCLGAKKKSIKMVDAYMSCKCGYEFCWLCLKSWRDTAHPQGGFTPVTIMRAKAEGKLKGEAADYANAVNSKQKEEQKDWPGIENDLTLWPTLCHLW